MSLNMEANSYDTAIADQRMKDAAEVWPAHLFAFFRGLVREGFEPTQALILTAERLKQLVLTQ